MTLSGKIYSLCAIIARKTDVLNSSSKFIAAILHSSVSQLSRKRNI